MVTGEALIRVERGRPDEAELPTGSRIEARTSSTELESVGRLGDLVFDGAYRRISIDDAARIRLTAADGDVEVRRLGGPVEISTARGDIRIAETVRGELVLRTQSGNISVSAAIGVSAIRATTSQGDITARSL